MGASAIDELRAAFEEPFAALGRDAARDRRSVVISWPSVPVELIRAAGFAAILARSSPAGTPAADRVVEPELFPSRLKQLVEAALAGRLANVAAIVLPRSSDADYKCFLYLRELVRRGVIAALPPVVLFDLLHSDGPDAQAYNAARVQQLSALLATLGGRAATPDELHREISSANRARAAARRLTALRRDPPRVTGTLAVPLLGAFWQLEPDSYAPLAAAAADAITGRAPLRGLRVLLAGAPTDSTALHAALEAEGAVVVAELSPFGALGVDADVAVSGDPYTSLAEHYRVHSVDSRLPARQLLGRFADVLGAADAVVVSLPPDDASFGWDYPRIRAQLGERSVPHAVLTGDPAFGATPTDRERIRSLLRSAPARREAQRG